MPCHPTAFTKKSHAAGLCIALLLGYIRVQLGCHRWSEFKQMGFVACPWVNNKMVHDLFKQRWGVA